MVYMLSTFSSQLLVVLAFGATRALVQRLTLVMALALILRGSKPGERPMLLVGVAACLSSLADTRASQHPDRLDSQP